VAVSEVVTFVPALIRPFKLGNAVRRLGALREDRLHAVGAAIDQESSLAPMRLHMISEHTDVDRVFNFNLWKNRQYLPELAYICMLETIDATMRSTGPMTMELEYDVELESGRRMVRRQ